MNLPVKYRPKLFDEVLGQEHVTRTLKNALKKKEISTAYLFTGPRGVGKTTVARLFSKGLNCDKGITPEPCNVCQSCREIDSSRSLDVIEVDGASNRGIDQIRSLQEKVRFAPQRGRYRVIIIDEVHMLTQEAFNALLKTLEEPPPNVVFIMATTEPRKVPETIVSRTQRFDFRPVSEELIAQRIRKVAELEGISVEEEAVQKIARHAEGSLRDGIALLEQLAVYAENSIKSSDVDHLLGVVEESYYLRLFEAILERNTLRAIEILDEIMAKGYSPQQFVRGFGEASEKLMRAHYGLEGSSFSELGKRLTDGDIIPFLRVALDLQSNVRYTSNPRLLLDYQIMRLTLLPSAVDIAEILRKSGYNVFERGPAMKLTAEEERRPQVEKFAFSETGEKPGEGKTGGAIPGELQSEERGIPYEKIREEQVPFAEPSIEEKTQSGDEITGLTHVIEKENPLLAGILAYARIEIKGDDLTLSVQDPFQMDMIKHHEDFIREKAKEVIGRPLTIRVEKGEGHRDEPDPLLLRLIEKFDLEVI